MTGYATEEYVVESIQNIKTIGKQGTGTNAEIFNDYSLNSAKGSYSHAEGNYTTAFGSCSHAEGRNTWAQGSCSHAEGDGTYARSACQHVQGRFNIKDEAGVYAHIVGNGEEEAVRSNAHTLDWAGNAWFSGNVYIGSTSGINRDEGSKKLLVEDDMLITVEDIDSICGANIQAVTSESGTF